MNLAIDGEREIEGLQGFLLRYPASTQIVYRQSLLEAARLIKKDLSTATHDDLVAYQQHINTQASATVKRKIATLGSYFLYLVVSGKRADNPTDGLRRPRVDPMRSIKWLHDSEVESLLQRASGEPRSLSLIWIALHGLRLAEIVSLDVDQYAEGTLWNVVGKGGKVRTIPLAKDAQTAVEEYIGNRKSGPLFLSMRHQRISRRTAQDLIYHLTRDSGKQVSIHALRHTYGTRATKRGVNSITLARLMGHSSTATTDRYAHLDPTALAEANESVYPTDARPPMTVIRGGRLGNS